MVDEVVDDVEVARLLEAQAVVDEVTCCPNLRPFQRQDYEERLAPPHEEQRNRRTASTRMNGCCM
jgi:hypothetical protein